MGAALGISLWIALVTVVPGLITLAVLACVALAAGLGDVLAGTVLSNDWVASALAITVMVLTQAIGILVEEVLIRTESFGPSSIDLEPDRVPPALVRGSDRTLDPYREYRGLYLLLSQLTKDEDSQGHLKRSIAQFFLSNNTMVAFGVGVAAALVAIARVGAASGPLLVLAAIFAACLVLNYAVARIRFRVMAKSLYAARVVRPTRPEAEEEAEPVALRVPVPAAGDRGS